MLFFYDYVIQYDMETLSQQKKQHSIQKLKFNYDLSANKPILAATVLV